jgi:hypothetical protein
LTVNGISKWNGTRWAAVGVGLAPPGYIQALTVYDDGSGAKLYAAGSFSSIGGVAASNVASWNGVTWSPVGGGVTGTLHALAVFDDGTGAALYAGGQMTSAGGTPVHHLAKWSGSQWSDVAGQLTQTSTPAIRALVVHDEGTGPALYVGGNFSSIGGVPATRTAKWDGTSWSAMGNPLQDVAAFASYDAGAGAQLYGGGSAGVSRWTGSSWVSISGFASVQTLVVHDDGSGDKLFAGGSFSSLGGVPAPGVARWDGVNWSALTAGPGLVPIEVGKAVYVWSLGTYDDGNGPALFLLGGFSGADGLVSRAILRWRATGYEALTPGDAPSSRVAAFDVFDDGSGDALYVGGSFTAVGATPARGIARWSGASWSALGTGVGANGEVLALADYDSGSGAELCAAGWFTAIGGVSASSIARWDGAQWSALGSGVGGFVDALAVFDGGGGPELVAAGYFGGAGSTNARSIARWNGASWSTLSSGLDNQVLALATYAENGAPRLFAGGYFTTAGGSFAPKLARWNGSSWSIVSQPPNGIVRALDVFDDGSGEALYVGGDFTTIGLASFAGIARWNGTSWSAVGSGLGTVRALHVFDDGSGLALYAVALAPGGASTSHVVRWNGSQWLQLGGEFDSGDFYPLALGSFSSVPTLGPALYLGGNFSNVGGRPSPFLAMWSRAYSCPPVSYCTAGTTTNGCNAHVVGTGTPSASASSGFVLDVVGVEGDKPGVIFYGISGRHSAPWGMGSSSYLCVKAPTQRSTFQFPGGTPGLCDGVLTLDWNHWVATHAGTLGAPFVAGQVVDTQGWFRDPPAPKTTSLSDALEFYVAP